MFLKEKICYVEISQKFNLLFIVPIFVTDPPSHKKVPKDFTPVEGRNKTVLHDKDSKMLNNHKSNSL